MNSTNNSCCCISVSGERQCQYQLSGTNCHPHQLSAGLQQFFSSLLLPVSGITGLITGVPASNIREAEYGKGDPNGRWNSLKRSADRTSADPNLVRDDMRPGDPTISKPAARTCGHYGLHSLVCLFCLSLRDVEKRITHRGVSVDQTASVANFEGCAGCGDDDEKAEPLAAGDAK
jgi:hypothetical protein